jgi:hypothetical protein
MPRGALGNRSQSRPRRSSHHRRGRNTPIRHFQLSDEFRVRQMQAGLMLNGMQVTKTVAAVNIRTLRSSDASASRGMLSPRMTANS